MTTAQPAEGGSLARYLGAADEADRQVRRAADAINARDADGEILVDEATAQAARDAETAVNRAAAAIPAGLEPGLLVMVLEVQSELVSRAAALSPAHKAGTLPVAEVEQCFRNGAAAAARFPGDLAELRSRASSAPSEPAAPDSRPAEELAVRLTEIDRRNRCADECGGFVVTELSPLTFYDTPRVDPTTGFRWDGTIGGVPFRSDLQDGVWSVELNAC
jgi:hypothetical protein